MSTVIEVIQLDWFD